MDVAAKIFQIIPDPTFVVHIQEKHDVQNQALADLILQDVLQSRWGNLEPILLTSLQCNCFRFVSYCDLFVERVKHQFSLVSVAVIP